MSLLLSVETAGLEPATRSLNAK